MNRRALRLTFSLLGAGAAAACADATSPPVPAPTAFRLDLATPHTDDGALVIALRGPEISSLEAASPAYLVYSRSGTAQETRIIVLGDLKAGPLLTLRIAPGHQLAEYTATIEQVATRSDALRDQLSGYRLSLTVP
ncbi:MAG: hypothetical protein ACREMI_03970 [Gemmatimonadales bacterium]